jgi:hypothetical protein
MIDMHDDTPHCACKPNTRLCDACRIFLEALTVVALAGRVEQSVDELSELSADGGAVRHVERRWAA